MPEFLHEYLHLLRDPAHWMFELSVQGIVDGLLIALAYPIIKRKVQKHDKEVHHTEDANAEKL